MRNKEVGDEPCQCPQCIGYRPRRSVTRPADQKQRRIAIVAVTVVSVLILAGVGVLLIARHS